MNIQELLALAEAVPEFIQLIEKVLGIIHSAPAASDGVKAIQAHMDTFDPKMLTMGPSDVKHS